MSIHIFHIQCKAVTSCGEFNFLEYDQIFFILDIVYDLFVQSISTSLLFLQLVIMCTFILFLENNVVDV